MEINQIKTLIKNYRNLLDRGNETILNQLYSQADMIVFEEDGNQFSNIETDNLFLFLAVESNKLVGFLAKDDTCYKKWNENTEILKATFSSKREVNIPNYTSGYVNTVSVDHPNFISPEIASERINLWSLHKLNWVAEMISANTMVRFFEVPTASFLNSQQNLMTLGINTETGFIDLVVENQGGLYNMTKPVPPYPARTKWPK